MDGQRPPTFMPAGSSASGGGAGPPPRFFKPPAAAGEHGEAPKAPARTSSDLPGGPASPFQSGTGSGKLPPPQQGAFGAPHTNPLYAAPAGGVPSMPAALPGGGMAAQQTKRFDLENAGDLRIGLQARPKPLRAGLPCLLCRPKGGRLAGGWRGPHPVHPCLAPHHRICRLRGPPLQPDH